MRTSQKRLFYRLPSDLDSTVCQYKIPLSTGKVTQGVNCKIYFKTSRANMNANDARWKKNRIVRRARSADLPGYRPRLGRSLNNDVIKSIMLCIVCVDEYSQQISYGDSGPQITQKATDAHPFNTLRSYFSAVIYNQVGTSELPSINDAKKKLSH